MDDKIVTVVDNLFEKAKAGDEESFKVIGEIFSINMLKEMLAIDHKLQTKEMMKYGGSLYYKHFPKYKK